MKKLITIAAIFVSLLQSYGQNLTGIWYGMKDRSMVTVEFGSDGKLDITNEAASNMTVRGTYRLSDDGTRIDITGADNALGGAGLIRYGKNGDVEMNIVFGIPGRTMPPKSIDPKPSSPENLYLSLTRDKGKVMGELPKPVEIPAEAGLAFERNARLGAGINLNAVVDGNLHPGYERDAPLQEGEIKSIADAGFKSVRLNVSWSRHCMPAAPYTIDPAFFGKVDGIVKECIDSGLAVSIDMHYYPYINMTNEDRNVSYEDNYKRLVCLWEQIAEHYKDYPDDMLYFDLLNEPNLVMGAEKWNSLFKTLISAVRKTNPGRTLLIATPDLGQSWTLNSLELPEDDWNLIVEFHYYLPHLFTHQSLGYAMAGHVKGMTWEGTEDEIKTIESDLDFCQRWSRMNGRPLNMGEYGVVNTADEASRARYIGFMTEAARKRGFSSHLWGYREPFMIRDEQSGKWIVPILDAMNL